MESLEGELSISEFPDEMLLKICHGMETPDLLSLSETSKRFSQVCGEVIQERKGEYLADKLIGDWLLQIQENWGKKKTYLLKIEIEPIDGGILVKGYPTFQLNGPISSRDLNKLETLHQLLIDQGFLLIKPTDKIWASMNPTGLLISYRTTHIFTTRCKYLQHDTILTISNILGIKNPEKIDKEKLCRLIESRIIELGKLVPTKVIFSPAKPIYQT